jgi:hypothetical protein
MREVFEESVSVRFLASALASYDAERTATKIQTWMERKDFDHIGVRRDGIVVGYARRHALTRGCLGDHLVEFSEVDIVPGQMPMLRALEAVRDQRRVFVTTLGEVNGIVTTGDVTKPPVRLWLFGLVMIFEMQVSRLIRARYQDDSWTEILHPSQVKKARDAHAKKSQMGAETELVDSLTLGLKQQILTSSPDLMAILELDSLRGTELIGRARELRNALAHVNDISTQWPGFLQLARDLELVIQRAEGVSRRTLQSLPR